MVPSSFRSISECDRPGRWTSSQPALSYLMTESSRCPHGPVVASRRSRRLRPCWSHAPGSTARAPVADRPSRAPRRACAAAESSTRECRSLCGSPPRLPGPRSPCTSRRGCPRRRLAEQGTGNEQRASTSERRAVIAASTRSWASRLVESGGGALECPLGCVTLPLLRFWGTSTDASPHLAGDIVCKVRREPAIAYTVRGMSMINSRVVVRVGLTVAAALVLVVAASRIRDQRAAVRDTVGNIEARLRALDPATRAAVLARLATDAGRVVHDRQTKA